MTIRGNFELFQYFNLETDFLENENHFQKLEYCLLVESTKIENTSFPYKTAMSEAHVKKIEWWVQNGLITKNGVLQVTAAFFWKFCFSFFCFIKSLFEVKNDPNEQRLNISLKFTQPILVQCHISIPPKNVRKPKVFRGYRKTRFFWRFRGSIEMWHWTKMG